MRRFKEWPIRLQLAVLALSTLLILLVLLLASYGDSIRAFNTNARESARAQMLQTELQVEQACRQMAAVAYDRFWLVRSCHPLCCEQMLTIQGLSLVRIVSPCLYVK